MKALASTLIATGVIVTAGLAAPAQAAAPETSAPAQVALEAPASAVLSFDRVHVTTAAAPARKARVAVPAPVFVAVPVAIEVPAPVAAPVVTVPVEVVLTVGGVNPECSEQWMQTAADGSCLPTECPVAGQTMTVEGDCVAEPVFVDVPTTEGNGQVPDNGNPDCAVDGAIQYSDGSCTFSTPVEEEDTFFGPMPGEDCVIIMPPGDEPWMITEEQLACK